MTSSCHQLSDTLINSVRCVSSAPSGRMLNLKKRVHGDPWQWLLFDVNLYLLGCETVQYTA